MQFLRQVARTLGFLSTVAMRRIALALLAAAVLSGVTFWVGLVLWPVTHKSGYMVAWIVGLAGSVLLSACANALWQAAKLR